MIKEFNKYSTKFNLGKIILTLILCVVLLSCKNSNFNKENSNQKTAFSTEFNFLPTSNTKEIVVHDFYTLSLSVLCIIPALSKHLLVWYEGGGDS